MSDLLNRLQIIQNAIALGDEDIIVLQAQRLPPEANELADLLQQQEYGRAATWMEDYRNNNLMMTPHRDPEVTALQLELAALENELTTLAEEKAEMESRVAEYTAAYILAVGDVLEELLLLLAQQADNQQAAQQAQQEYENFHQQRQEQPQVQHLDDDEKEELRALYRKAAQKCHPDRLPEEQKEAGTAIFQQLEEARRTQDIERVRELWQQLEHGDWQTASATLARDGNADALRRRALRTRRQLEELRAEIETIRSDDTWRLLMQLEADGMEWEEYFSQQRREMEKKLAALKQ